MSKHILLCTYLPESHVGGDHPGSHPEWQLPFVLSHTVPAKQWPHSCWQFKPYLPSMQVLHVGNSQPSSQPVMHSPVILSHAIPDRQRPHDSEHPGPYDPSGQPAIWMKVMYSWSLLNVKKPGTRYINRMFRS